MMVWAVSLSSTDLSTDVLTAVIIFAVFVVYEGWVRLLAPVLNRALPPQKSWTTLALKLFRGEPAISEFDWHFTANHSSSKPFETDPGSVLHSVLPLLQPGHG